MWRYLNSERGCGFATQSVDQQFVSRRCTKASLRHTGKAGKEHSESTACCRAAEGIACAKKQHPSAAVIKESTCLNRQGGPEICCCSCIWPDTFSGQVAQNWAIGKPGGKAMAKLTHKHCWVFCSAHQQAQRSTIQFPKTPGEKSTRVTFWGTGKETVGR